jgi:hypothetical protein
MLRIATLAAAAAILVAAPASAASINVPTAGKSPDQVKAEVAKAASRLCRRESWGSALEEQLQASCVSATVRSALTSAADPAVKVAVR